MALTRSSEPQTTMGWAAQRARYLWFTVSVSYSGQAEPHSFPKAPLCHELSLNATLLSIDLSAMHFLSCFDVIVVSVYGRFQIKLWRVLALKLVISGDYSAAVELTFFILFLATNWIMWLCSAEAISNAHRLYATSMNPHHCGGDRCWLAQGRSLCQGSVQNKTHSANVVQRDHYVL